MGEHIAQLEKGIETLHRSARSLADDDGYSELLRIIRRPGWTTPAEIAFFLAALEGMQAQVHELTRMKTVLVGAAEQVAVKEAAAV
jgi:hypothetical protein